METLGSSHTRPKFILIGWWNDVIRTWQRLAAYRVTEFWLSFCFTNQIELLHTSCIRVGPEAPSRLCSLGTRGSPRVHAKTAWVWALFPRMRVVWQRLWVRYRWVLCKVFFNVIVRKEIVNQRDVNEERIIVYVILDVICYGMFVKILLICILYHKCKYCQLIDVKNVWFLFNLSKLKSNKKNYLPEFIEGYLYNILVT